MTGGSSLRVVGAIILTALLLLLSSCAVPLAPGYAIEQQQLEVHYITASPAQLKIRATYRLKNTGNSSLAFVEAALPSEQTAGQQSLRAWVDGREAALQPAGDVDGRGVRILFDPPWLQRQRRGLVLEYGLSPLPPGDAALAVNDGAFHIRNAAAFPKLRAPEGTFTEGGEPPDEFRLTVYVPVGFRVAARGHEQGSRRRTGELEHRFRIARKGFRAYVVAGRYQEQQIKTADGTVVFWTFEPLADEQAQIAALRLARTLQTYRKAFGALGRNPPPVRIVETSARLTQRFDGSADPAGVAFPAGALLNRRAFALGISSETFLELAEHELAHTWFGEAIALRAAAEPALGEGLAEYATVVAAEARGGEAERRRHAALLLRWFDESHKQATDKPLLRLAPTDPFEQRLFGYSKGALFFIALEDRYGEENVRRALRHLVSSLRGAHFGFAALRAALELETKQPLGDFFRLWLDQTGIPAEVRARYEVKQQKSENREKGKQEANLAAVCGN